ncbi:MAG: Hsp20/alpha crystallin family protein [Candidatus Omnitrophota bacterium]
MRNNKIIMALVIVLAVGLIFETGYLLGKKKIDLRKVGLSMEDKARQAGEPFVEMQRMHRKMDRMFRDSFSRFMHHPDFKMLQGEFTFEPEIEIAEGEGEYIVLVDLPGVEKGKINIEVKGNTLTISGERRIETKTGREGFYRAERSFGSFCRSMTLPGDIEGDKVTAESVGGVLMIKLPKKVKEEESRQPRVKVEVK